MSVTMKSLEALLDKKFKEFEARVLTPVKETIDGMEASLNFMSKQQDDMAKSLKDLQDKNKFLETENSLLRVQLAAVQNDINQQKDTLNEYEEFSRRECLEFCGIGKRPIEDTNKIILTIGDALGVQINEEDISATVYPKTSTTSTSPQLLLQSLFAGIRRRICTVQGANCGI